jgi:hypothetical protein
MLYDLTRASDRALRHVEVSAATACPPEAFARVLATGIDDPVARPALRLFLEEGDADMLVDLVTEGASSFAVLADLSRALLPPDHPTTVFLREPPP